MIRDPSDGSVRSEVGIPTSTGESPAILNPLREAISAALLAGKVKPERLSEQWAYQRAWNDGIDFSLKQIDGIFKRNPEQGT